MNANQLVSHNLVRRFRTIVGEQSNPDVEKEFMLSVIRIVAQHEIKRAAEAINSRVDE